MEKINRHRYELTSRDLRELGSSIEEVLESVSERDFGKYKVDNANTKLIIALRLAEGMYEWQRKTNKGIELIGTFNVVLHIFDVAEKQKRLDDAMDSFEL